MRDASVSLCCFCLRHTPHASHPLCSPTFSNWGLSAAFRSHRGCRGRAPSLTAVPAAPQPVPPHNRRSRGGNLHPLSSHAVFTLTRAQPKPSQNTHGAVSTRPSRTEESVRDSPTRPDPPRFARRCDGCCSTALPAAAGRPERVSRRPADTPPATPIGRRRSPGGQPQC